MASPQQFSTEPTTDSAEARHKKTKPSVGFYNGTPDIVPNFSRTGESTMRFQRRPANSASSAPGARSEISKADLERWIEIVAGRSIPPELMECDYRVTPEVFAANTPFTIIDILLESFDDDLFRDRGDTNLLDNPTLDTMDPTDNPFVKAFMQRCKMKRPAAVTAKVTTKNSKIERLLREMSRAVLGYPEHISFARLEDAPGSIRD